jgi:HEAT repeat protein
MAALVAVLFAVIEAGRGIGSNAADALFFLRFGVQFLPYMFILLGVATFVVAVSYTAALSRLRHRDLYVGSLALFALIVFLEWGAIHLDLALLYPVLWLSINVISAVLGLQVWHVAGEVTDTRQAKRLNSIFISGGIVGSLVGNVATGQLAGRFGTQNLLVLYAILLLAGFALTIAIGRRFFGATIKTGRRVGVWARLRAGFNYERGSKMLRLISYVSVVFSILYFSVSFPFSKIVSASFPNEADVASFLGLFSAAATVVTLLASLVVANRLYSRIGIVDAVLILPLVYLGGFILWALSFSLATAAVVRLTQMVILGGVASPAWNALFNVAPPERRGEVLGFDAAIPSQAGVVLSGLLLILADRGLGTSQIFTMGMIVALICAFLIWRMRPAYGEALVLALRAGRFEVFGGGEGALLGFRSDAGAVRVALDALHDVKASTRRLAVEILAKIKAKSAVPTLIKTLQDSDIQVRLAALRALGDLGANETVDSIISSLVDRDPEVRTEALGALSKLRVQTSPSLVALLQGLVRDADCNVSAEAAVLLAKLSGPESAAPIIGGLLADEKTDVRIAGLRGLGKIAALSPDHVDGKGFDLSPIFRLTLDPTVALRRAACQTLGEIGEEAGIEPLVRCLNDSDSTVRNAAAQALRKFGPRATVPVMRVLDGQQDRAQDAALDALAPDASDLFEPLSQYAQREIAQVMTWRDLASVMPSSGQAAKLLRELLSARASQSELRLVKTVGLLGDRDAMGLVAKSLRSRDAETRAEAVETLETLGDKRLAKTIIPLLEDSRSIQGRQAAWTPAEGLAHLMAQRDSWTRALAARAAAELNLSELAPNLSILAREDRDPLAREAAHEAIIHLGAGEERDVPMETLQTVSSLERIILLRDVPLFAELDPDDLKQIADIAREQLYPADAVLCREGEEGDELYVLASGQVRVTKGSNGSEKIVARRGVGEFLGEMAIFESAEHSATVRAEGEVRALVIDADAFKSILRDRPEVSLAVLRVLSRRLREMM